MRLYGYKLDYEKEEFTKFDCDYDSIDSLQPDYYFVKGLSKPVLRLKYYDAQEKMDKVIYIDALFSVH